MNSVSRQLVVRLLGMAVVTAASLFLPAGTLAWWNAWVFLGVGIALVALLTGSVFHKTPDLVLERRTAGQRAKAWDRVLVPVLAGVLPLSSNLVAGFDKRMGWTTGIGATASLVGLAAMLVGIAITFRAMQANRFFSSHVRIQHDRGHVVVDQGPYGVVRHPGYVGTILYNLGAPMLLGSATAFWIGLAIGALFVVRTALEDRTLQAELPGYAAYAERVRFRLIPKVW